MSKYIIEFEDAPFTTEDGVEYFKCIDATWWGATKLLINRLKNYNENDEYQRGLNDAWEAAVNICKCDKISWLYKEFGTEETDSIIPQTTASEVIAKLKAYEEEQKNKIVVGDEVKLGEKTKAVVVGVYADELRVLTEDKYFETIDASKVTKTGRHFPEIKQVLERMRE